MEESDRIANEELGEFEIVIGEKTFILRYPFSAMKELKTRYKKPVQQYFKDKGDNIDEEDVATIVCVGLKHGGNPIEMETLMDMMVMSKLGEYSGVMLKAMSGKTKKKEGEESEEDPTTGTK